MPASNKRWNFFLSNNKDGSARKGFTLIELLAVIAIIGVLATIITIGLTNTRKKARDAQRKSDLIQFRLALELYYNQYGVMPWGDATWIASSLGYTNDIQGCDNGGAVLLGGWDEFGDLNGLVLNNYIGKLPLDPLNDSTHCYIYAPNPDFKGACVWGNKELGNRRKIGITVGDPDPTIPSNGGPAGYECNFIEDEILGGVYLNPVAICGNGVCENTEQMSCPADCGGGAPVCGDGVCSPGETCAFDCNAGSGS